MQDVYKYKTLKIVNKIFNVLLILVLFICLYSFINLNLLSKKYVNFFSYTVFQIGSNSMAPTITTNDLIIVKIDDKIDVDDIITYEDDNKFITHRVIQKNNNSYITKGDANNSEDSVVTESQVLGKVVKIMPNMGVWYKVFTTPKVIFLIILSLFLFSLAFSYKNKRKLTKNDDFGIYYSGVITKGEKK